MVAARLGRTIVPVVEKPSELGMILEHAEALGVRPSIGFRVKLASQGAGRWRDSAGARSKFGLFLSEVLELFGVLRERGMEDRLQLIHCHPGSQLQDIRRIKDAVAELAHVHCSLARMGAGLKYLDVGGGLGVDYDGSRTNFASSMNYSIEEYASEVVYRIGAVCDQHGVEHPTIVSESGRAIAAYQSVLVFDVLGSSGLDRFRAPSPPEPAETKGGAPAEELPPPIRDLVEAHEGMSERRLIECWHDAGRAREQCQQLFSLGYLSLELRARADELYWATAVKARDLARRLDAVPEELEDLEEILSGIYFCNLSIFQSLPDAWAIGQLFPIMPIHRLDERPTEQAVLADITCDSDGRIDRFVDVRDVKRTLPLHRLRPDEPYYLAAFLVGAYQETLGDLHNLFGDPHVVHVVIEEDGSWRIDEFVEGDTVREALAFVQYDAGVLLDRLARDLERAASDGVMRGAEATRIRAFYERELRGFTYLDRRNPARESGT
jgi:arginine decarboxylase